MLLGLFLILKLCDMAKYSKDSQESVKEAIEEMKEGKLKSGTSGKIVTNPKQAVAIGLSEARAKGDKIPRKADTSTKGKKPTK